MGTGPRRQNNAAPQASPSVAPADSESGSAVGPAVAAPGEKQHETPINLQRELRRNYLGAVPVHVVRVMELAAGRLDLLERELASAKRDADHFFQLSGRYLEELSAASAIERRDLEDALNIGLAALGDFNTEKMDKHWNEQERVLREIEKKMRRADNRNKDKP